MSKLYGTPPADLGLVELDPQEMMFWLYCPVKMPGGPVVLPANLMKFHEIVNRVRSDLAGDESDARRWFDNYVYITAKTLFVTADNPGNRPGWHSDGFMTSDLNYIWYDGNPTLFWEPKQLEPFTQDDRLSLAEMQDAAGHWTQVNNYKTYPNKHLLKLDERVIHRVADVEKPGVRTFVKISVSRFQYRLLGNSINYDLAPHWQWDMETRSEERNQPQGGAV